MVKDYKNFIEGHFMKENFDLIMMVTLFGHILMFYDRREGVS